MVNPPGGLLCHQTFGKTEEIACALGKGYKILIQYDQSSTTNIHEICRVKNTKEMHKGLTEMSLGSGTMSNFFSFDICISPNIL